MSNKTLTPHQIEAMFQAYKKGYSLKEIADQNQVSTRTMTRLRKDGEWDKRKDTEALTAKRSANLIGKQELSLNLFNETLELAYELLKGVKEEAIENGFARVPLKQITDVVDKLVRLQMFMDSGGVSKKQVEVREHKIDWNDMIKATLEAKKDDPNFDDREFVRKAVNKVFNKDE